MKQRLYHGSNKSIKGKLIPKQSKDVGQNPENLIKGIYSTDIKNLAIAMAIISNKKVKRSSLNFSKYEKGKTKAIIYEGWPEQEYVYLYKLPPTTFAQSKGIAHQFVSTKPINPLSIEKIKVKYHLHLIRKATEEDQKKWKNKFGILKT